MSPDGRAIATTLAAAFLTAALAAAQPTVSANSESLPEVARQVPPGGELRIDGLLLDLDEAAATLSLHRFEVFAEEARILVHGVETSTLAPPDNRYFKGSVAGDPASVAFLTVREVGGMRGLVASRGRYWVLAGGAAAGGPSAGLAARPVDVEEELRDKVANFSCQTSELTDVAELVHLTFGTGGASAEVAAVRHRTTASYSARLAIETDWEFFQLFGNATDATDYVGDVIGYTSGIYTTEIDTSLAIEVIHLYDQPNDPWVESSTLCGLFEFGRHWNDNFPGVDRTLAHFMSGKNNGGGVAWVGVLCSNGFTYNHQGQCPGLSPQTDNYGGGYGYSGSLDGDFDITNPGPIWDIVVVAHEIGHNFNSPHTHCYGGLGGNSDPVDGCYAGECGNGCYCGSTGLPSGCSGPGAGCGTIMSYCHLLSGGLGNISLTFGEGHPFGVAPERVGARMNDHVTSVAALNPSCLEPVAAAEIFSDGFESGDVAAWGGP